MAQDLNSVNLIGRLVKDPEQIGDKQGARFSLAVADRRKRNDEWEDYTHFVDVTTWGGQAAPVLTHCKKGMRVAIHGKLEQQRWEQDGNKRSKVAVVAFQVQFVEPRRTEESESDPTQDEFGL